MKKNGAIYLIFLMVLALFACRKEADNNPPRISVSGPAWGTSYNVYDTIWVNALITDNTKLVSVKIALLDESQKPVLSVHDFKPGVATLEVSEGIPLDDIHLASGTYTLQVQAFDGTNYTNNFIELRVNELPLEMKYPVLISRNGMYGINISVLESGTIWRKVLSLESDYQTSDVSSYDQQVYTAGQISGNLNACLLPAGPVVWEVPLLSAPPYRYFEALFYEFPLLYVAYYEGKILGYDRFGVVKYSSETEPGYIPEAIGKSGDFVLAGERRKTGSARAIGVYYAVTGSRMQSLEVSLDIVSFKTIDKDHVLVFGNNGNTGIIMEYHISENHLRHVHTFSDGKIGAVVQANSSNFFVAGANAVHRYIYPTNTLVQYIQDAPGALLDFDVVNDQIFALYNHQLKVYGFPDASIVVSIPVADSAFSFHLMYNK